LITANYVAGDDDNDDYDGEVEPVFEEEGETLGSLAWTLGLLLNTLFVAVNRARKILRLRLRFKTVLDIHIASNIILGSMAILHGLIFISSASLLEYILVILIAILLASGTAMRFVMNRDVRLLNRLVHTQLLLSIIIAILIYIHILTVD